MEGEGGVILDVSDLQEVDMWSDELRGCGVSQGGLKKHSIYQDGF